MKLHTDSNFYMGTRPVVYKIFDKHTSFLCYASNNWLKMHGKPMRRKPLRKVPGNVVVIGKTGTGKSFSEKICLLRNKCNISNIGGDGTTKILIFNKKDIEF